MVSTVLALGGWYFHSRPPAGVPVETTKAAQGMTIPYAAVKIHTSPMFAIDYFAVGYYNGDWVQLHCRVGRRLVLHEAVGRWCSPQPAYLLLLPLRWLL